MKKKKKAKKKPDFYLDMPFDEALERFSGTSPQELERLMEKGRAKKPPGSKKKRKPPSGTAQKNTNVVSLSARRKPKYV
jgi:hypothetical protein